MSELCEVKNCNSSECVKRHPRICRFFSKLNRCKFNEFCLYSHVQTRNDQSDRDDINKKVESLEHKGEALEGERKALLSKLSSLELSYRKLTAMITTSSGLVTPCRQLIPSDCNVSVSTPRGSSEVEVKDHDMKMEMKDGRDINFKNSRKEGITQVING